MLMKLSDLTIPAVAECDPKVEPMHAKVLVVPAEVPEKKGAIFLAASTHEKDVFANQRARIVALGPVAFQFEDWPASARKPQVGDVILHESYIGEEVEGEDGRKYRLINDRAVMAVLERRDEMRWDIVDDIRRPTAQESVAVAYEHSVKEMARGY
jgi:co-chaperonin GroES (HSP10)